MLEAVLISIFCVIMLFAYVLRPVTVEGHSMESTLQDQDKLFMTDLFYTPERGDIVIIDNDASHTFDENGNLVSKAANSVVIENCSNNHAEINAIKEAQMKLATYDLSSYNLSIYITAEPCMMCVGAIMWSGIKNVYYSVPSETVEKITGFDEGFKPSWLKEFKKRGIAVYGNIEAKLGEVELKQYVQTGKKIYKPERKQQKT